MRSASEPSVGFVGLGNLGLPIARRLASAGLLHLAWARTARDHDVAPGVTWTSTLGELAASADVLGVCVTDDHAVETVVTEALAALRPGSTIVIHSTVRPSTCQALAARADVVGVSLLDAPVCGGPAAASAGELLISVGGDGAAVQRVRPLLDALALLWRHIGEVGSGQQVKLLMNLMYAANVQLLCDGLAAGEHIGIDRGVLGEFVRSLPSNGFVGSFLATGVPGPALVEHGRLLIQKDVEYAAAVLADRRAEVDRLVELGRAAVVSLVPK